MSGEAIEPRDRLLIVEYDNETIVAASWPSSLLPSLVYSPTMYIHTTDEARNPTGQYTFTSPICFSAILWTIVKSLGESIKTAPAKDGLFQQSGALPIHTPRSHRKNCDPRRKIPFGGLEIIEKASVSPWDLFIFMPRSLTAWQRSVSN